MQWPIFLAIIIGVPIVTWIANRVGLIDLSNKSERSGGSGGLATMMDEVFAPTKHEAQAEADRQSRLPQEHPTPADDDHDLLSGRMLIKVPTVRRDADRTKH